MTVACYFLNTNILLPSFKSLSLLSPLTMGLYNYSLPSVKYSQLTLNETIRVKLVRFHRTGSISTSVYDQSHWYVWKVSMHSDNEIDFDV
ncbi:unnamed protein product [Heterobilharzia americana]|nr:unnamed protein product [Heterobilharzia americana]